MEPPSPILNASNAAADAMSDDPLADYILMILDSESASGDGCGQHLVCAYTARTGLLYIGATGEELS